MLGLRAYAHFYKILGVAIEWGGRLYQGCGTRRCDY